MPKFKGKEINTKPTDGMVSEAVKGLEWRKEHGRGGTEVGVARARDIKNRKELSFDTVKRMYSFFSRHEVDKKAEGFSPGEKGYPSAGRIAWALWGGGIRSINLYTKYFLETMNDARQFSKDEIVAGKEDSN